MPLSLDTILLQAITPLTLENKISPQVVDTAKTPPELEEHQEGHRLPDLLTLGRALELHDHANRHGRFGLL